jgi:hypothetical protein
MTDPLLTGYDPESEDYGWRLRVYDALQSVGFSQVEAQEYLACGNTWLGVEMCENDIAHSRAIPATCHKRYCPECARRDGARLVTAYVPQVQRIIRESSADEDYRLRHIVLTSDIDLNEFLVVQKFKLFKKCVALFFDHYCGAGLSPSNRARWSEPGSKCYTGEGYICSFEFGEGGKRLHAHLTFFGRFIPKYEMSEVWAAITEPMIGAQQITWIESVANHKKAIGETLKYITKFTRSFHDSRTGEITKMYPDPMFIARLALLLKGTRRVITRGIFRGLENDLAEPGQDIGEHVCRECASASIRIGLTEWLDTYRDSYQKRLLDLKSGNKIARLSAAKDPDPPPNPVKIESALQFGVLKMDQQAVENWKKYTNR